MGAIRASPIEPAHSRHAKNTANPVCPPRMPRLSSKQMLAQTGAEGHEQTRSRECGCVRRGDSVELDRTFAFRRGPGKRCATSGSADRRVIPVEWMWCGWWRLSIGRPGLQHFQVGALGVGHVLACPSFTESRPCGWRTGSTPQCRADSASGKCCCGVSPRCALRNSRVAASLLFRPSANNWRISRSRVVSKSYLPLASLTSRARNLPLNFQQSTRALLPCADGQSSYSE